MNLAVEAGDQNIFAFVIQVKILAGRHPFNEPGIDEAVEPDLHPVFGYAFAELEQVRGFDLQEDVTRQQGKQNNDTC
jgi:hypothetical protein